MQQPQNHTVRDANEALVLALLRADEAAERAALAEATASARAADLRDVAEFRERLIGIVGHDLRNPLNSVLMAAGLLVSSGHLQPAEAQLAGRIVDSSRRMREIIAQLLDFTRARLGGGFPLEVRPLNLGALCAAIAQELQLTTHTKLEVTQRGNLDGRWDDDRLGAVISNVLGNAIQHATPGSTIVTDVHDDVHDGVERVIVAITNRGAVIPEDVLSVIFQPFRQAAPNSSPRGAGNLGLGLYIAHEIVRSHDGSLSVVSAEGATTFTIALPRVTAELHT